MTSARPATEVGAAVRRLAAPVAALAGVGAAWLAAVALDAGDAGPTLCPWRSLTGLDCPFCGATRAAVGLAGGDILGALDHNALLVLVVLPLAGAAWIAWVSRAWRGEPPGLTSNRTISLLVSVTLAWWALRLAVPWLGSGLSGVPGG